ncbi:PQQ-like beta-propeller repeat protein [Pirellulales bacterium]|nr:PQQ-like beta-propeller repeat protein [Pirellulales bacterium]
MNPTLPAPEGDSSATRHFIPPVKIWVTLASLATATVLVRYGWLEVLVGDVIDQAVRNIITLILAFTGCVSLFIWFIRESDFQTVFKKRGTVGLVALIILALAVLRIERVSGDLVPQFAFRWQARSDSLLPPAATIANRTNNQKASSIWNASPDDSPCFLGPQGTASIDGIEIDTTWSRHPPRCIWKRPIGAGWSGFATYGSHAATLEQRGNDEAITCYSIATGEPEWAVSVPARHETVLGGIGPRSTPTIYDGIVYATGATGWLHAIEGNTGKVLWRKDIVADLGIDRASHAAAVAWGRAGSPLVTEQLVIVPAGGPRTEFDALEDDADETTRDPKLSRYISLVAYDRTNGDQKWIAGTEQISYASPQLIRLGDRNAVITVNEGHVAAYEIITGHQLWQSVWPGHSNSDASCSQPHILAGDSFFISKGYGIGSAVFSFSQSNSDWTVKPVWQQSNLLKTKFTNVAIHNGYAYGLSDGILECVELSSGKRMWKQGRYGQGQLLRVGATLLIQAESGEVVAVPATPEKPSELSRFPALNGQTWNNLCLSGNNLLVRNAEEAACYEVSIQRKTALPQDAAQQTEKALSDE